LPVNLNTVVGVIGITNVLRMAGYSPVCWRMKTLQLKGWRPMQSGWQTLLQ